MKKLILFNFFHDAHHTSATIFNGSLNENSNEKSMNRISHFVYCLTVLFIFTFPQYVSAQEKIRNEKEVTTLTDETFGSLTLINNETADVLKKKELEFSYRQRFGMIKNDADMFGLFSPSNMRLGVDYGVLDKLTIGAGVTQLKKNYDLNIKYKIAEQNKVTNMPVTITYFGEMSRCGLSNDFLSDRDGVYDPLYRFSFFNELIVARKFNEKFSLQAALTFSHFNLTEPSKQNENFGISMAGKYKLSEKTAFIFDADCSVGQTGTNAPKPNLGLGIEFKDRANTFQIFVSTANNILNDAVRVENENDIFKREFLIGFNFSRSWELKKHD